MRCVTTGVNVENVELGVETLTALCVRDGESVEQYREECVAVEEPLEIRVRGVGPDGPFRETLAVTMRTPGHDHALALGFLCAEGVLENPEDVLDVDGSGNTVEVTLSMRAVRVLQDELPRFARRGTLNASCGVCGKKSIAALRVRQRSHVENGTAAVSPTILTGLGNAVRAGQPLFDVTGGIHAAALFDLRGGLLASHEDVGRHNALDKLLGTAFVAGLLPLRHAIVWVSGRTSFELVQKIAVAACPFLVSVGAPSSLAVQLARACNVTLVGFLRGERFNVYAGEERITELT